mgnify:CR=1 FL=1
MSNNALYACKTTSSKITTILPPDQKELCGQPELSKPIYLNAYTLSVTRGIVTPRNADYETSMLHTVAPNGQKTAAKFP